MSPAPELQDGLTALRLAFMFDEKDVVVTLLENNADKEAQDKVCATHWAAAGRIHALLGADHVMEGVVVVASGVLQALDVGVVHPPC